MNMQVVRYDAKAAERSLDVEADLDVLRPVGHEAPAHQNINAKAEGIESSWKTFMGGRRPRLGNRHMR
jgi:hypothetical protein